MRKERIMLRTSLAFALLVTLTIGLASCKRQDDESSATPSTTSQRATHTQQPTAADWRAPTAKRPYKIGVLFPMLAAPFWVNEAYGVLDEAKKLGLEVTWLSADGYTNVDKQVGQIEDLVTLRVDAILLASTSFTGTARAVDEATRHGIPVFAHVTSSSADSIVSAILCSDVEIGRAQARFMGKTLSGRGQVAMLNGPAGAEWSMNRVKGFKEVLKADFPGIRIVAERFGVPDRADAQRQAEDLLTAFGDLDGIFTVADGMAIGTADAVLAAGRIDDVTITTASFSRESVEYITKGHIDLNVDESPVLQGRWAINTVVRSLNGEEVPKLILVPNPGVTKENIGKIDTRAQWAPEGWSVPRG